MTLMTDAEFEALIDRNSPSLGKGGSRLVHAALGRDDLVIKESLQPFPSGNFTEWTVWNAVEKMAEDIMGNQQNTDLLTLFARCFSISQNGRYLMMERLLPLEPTDRVPMTKFPQWLTDKKPNAFGRTAEGQIKVLDYGLINFYLALNPKNRNGNSIY
ncbi:hypothetical protein ASD04_11270 [Devosia sp. Root436]|nr:hypothetical protein ASD04_11270 [Devosia sp. Root436]